jgi:hypothetical protein
LINNFVEAHLIFAKIGWERMGLSLNEVCTYDYIGVYPVGPVIMLTN